MSSKSPESTRKHPLTGGEEKIGAKHPKRYTSVKELLEGEASKPKDYNPAKPGVIYGVDVVLSDSGQNDGTCYFMAGNRDVKFRHMGHGDACPPVFYVSPGQPWNEDSEVLMYFTSSGSGKTVELACSAYTREADLALLLNGIKDSRPLQKAQEKYFTLSKGSDGSDERVAKQLEDARAARHREAAVLLCSNVHHGASRDLLKRMKALASPKQPLKIVVCLDEVYSCPILVRCIIEDRRRIAEYVVTEFFGLNSMHLFQIVFSCAGTGAARSSVGSNVDNFKANIPTARSFKAVQRMFDRGIQVHKQGLKLIFPDGETREVNYENVDKHLPFVRTLLENGRMNTIASQRFCELNAGRMIDEGELLSEIIGKYINANGLQVLETQQDRLLMGASAIATILFQPDGEGQKKLPDTDWEVEMFHSNGNATCFEFENEAIQVPESGENVVLYLQGKLGLIEPNNKKMKWTAGSRIRTPFKMDPPQELVALQLLGIDLKKLLRLDPFGFEVVTTHLIKCALTAACVVKGEKKPTVKEALSKIGFAPHVAREKTLTDDKVVKWWNALDSWRPCFHDYESFVDERSALHRETHFMSVELEHLKSENWLRIDNSLFKVLEDMRALGMGNNSDAVFAPFGSINYGSSPLFDGSVTFYMFKKVDDEGNTEVRRCTVMNQAKDYAEDGQLDYGRLKEHANRCNESVLNGVFGKDRLLCLSGRESVVSSPTAKSSKHGRPYLPFLVNKSLIMRKLLQQLDKRRTEKARKGEKAAIVDENGERVNEPTV